MQVVVASDPSVARSCPVKSIRRLYRKALAWADHNWLPLVTLLMLLLGVLGWALNLSGGW